MFSIPASAVSKAVLSELTQPWNNVKSFVPIFFYCVYKGSECIGHVGVNSWYYFW